MKSDSSHAAMTWPDSLEEIREQPSTPTPPRPKRKIAYAVVLGILFSLGVLLVTLNML